MNVAVENATVDRSAPVGAMRDVIDTSWGGGTRRRALASTVPRPVSDRRYPVRNGDHYLCCAKRLRHRVVEKPDPCGSGLSSSAREPTITFQRGTAADLSVAIWEDGQPIAGSNNLNMPSDLSPNNLEARMPAMRGSQAAVRSTRFARYSRRRAPSMLTVHSLLRCRLTHPADVDCVHATRG